MKAMIFAAGVGSRLKPYTDFHPKALVPVGGIPALGRVLCKIKDAGVTDTVVNVHHFGSQITEFLRANDNFGMNIIISDETGCLLDTGGGLLKAASFLTNADGEPILLHNADIITDFPLSEMLHEHESNRSDVTLLVDERKSSRQLCFSSDMKLKGWQNLKTGEVRPVGCTPEDFISLAFGGVHIISPAIFCCLNEYAGENGGADSPFSIIPFYLWSIGRLRITGYKPSKPYIWHDVGTSEKLAEANKVLAGGI